MSRSRTALVALVALVLPACHPSGPSKVPSEAPVDAPTATTSTEALPALNLASPLPPAPVPATFDVAALASRVAPSVVNITTTQRIELLPEGHLFPFFVPGGPGSIPSPEQSGAGTGFVIDSAGYVVTNAHVIDEADSVRVVFTDEREFEARVVGKDEKLDLALLKVDGAGDLATATLGESETLRIGEHVLAVGNPFGLGHTVTLGIVSAKSRAIGAGPYDDFIQTDASINPGNSGGPLFNWRGEVVGINTAIRPGANNIGFAIPVDALKDILGQLRDNGKVIRGKLGLVFQPITQPLATALGRKDTKGALVSDIEQGGAAARAGILPGDIIVSVDGARIAHAEELPRKIARNAPGSKVKIGYFRGATALEATVTLDTLADDPRPARERRAPEDPTGSRLGIQVSNAPGGGVRVDGLSKESAVKELRPGDVILSFDRSPVSTTEDLEKKLRAARPGSISVAQVRRGPSTRFVPIPIPQASP